MSWPTSFVVAIVFLVTLLAGWTAGYVKACWDNEYLVRKTGRCPREQSRPRPPTTRSAT